jgi:hypothetical protein
MLHLLIRIIRVLFSLIVYGKVVLHAVALAGRVGALARGLHLRLEVASAFALVVSERCRAGKCELVLAGSVLILFSACPQKK